MISTFIGIVFIICGIAWAMGAIIRGGMTEYRARWNDVPPDIFWSIPVIALGIAIVWR